MSIPENFDPYARWLGITADQRPPSHYQLLDVSPMEQDHRVIEMAAVRQSSLVRACQSLETAAYASRIIAEIAEARSTLIDPVRRKQYDMKLGITGPAPQARPPLAPVPKATPKTPAPQASKPTAPVARPIPAAPPPAKRRDTFELAEAQVEIDVEPKHIAKADVEENAPRKRRVRNSEDVESEQRSPVFKIVAAIASMIVVCIVSYWAFQTLTSRDDKSQVLAPPMFSKEEMDRKAATSDPPRKVHIPSANRSDSPSPEKKSGRAETIRTAERESIDFEKSAQDIDVQSIDTKIDPGDVGQEHFIAKQARLSRMYLDRPKNIIESEILVDEALKILKTTNHELKKEAICALELSIPYRRTKEVEERLLPYLDDREFSAYATSAAIIWECPNAVAKIESLTSGKDTELANAVLTGIGRAKQTRFLPILINGFKSDSKRVAAAKALLEFGEACESPLLELISTAESALFSDGCEVLKRIGTSSSMKMFRERSNSKSKKDSATAEAAIAFLEKAMDAKKSRKMPGSEEESE